MTAAAIIAEYNPLHNGHAYQLTATKAMGFEAVAVIMSGNFTQRGACALYPKQVRAKAALLMGADLVAELPLPYAVSGAERFAGGGVQLAASLRGVSALVFGSECGSLPLLTATAKALEDPGVWQLAKELLTDGRTFAAAREEAVRACHGKEIADVLAAPNDILGVEYIRAIRRFGAKLTPIPIRRIGAGHDSSTVENGICSASQIRAQLHAGAPQPLLGLVPEAVRPLYEAAPHFLPPALELPLLTALRALPESAYLTLPDCSEGLQNRLYKAVLAACSLPELHALIKTRRYPLTRVQRLCLSAFLGITESDGAGVPPYLRLLALSTAGAKLLSGRCTLPVDSSLQKLYALGGRAARLASLESAATDRYNLLLNVREKCGMDYRLKLAKHP